ncbi:hypothetical protein EV213_102366 [Aureibacillus halotolerans]|uniref:Uncharacterized protein n=1 Tax=Aureibacillus halotolerans TaxID=1508390 RepID=A0A4R6UGR8_9BACI|nr:hypothetical protein EV213_102366 [Aureibacillus halotolerans]
MNTRNGQTFVCQWPFFCPLLPFPSRLIVFSFHRDRVFFAAGVSLVAAFNDGLTFNDLITIKKDSFSDLGDRSQLRY